jgi:hypothetical protein
MVLLNPAQFPHSFHLNLNAGKFAFLKPSSIAALRLQSTGKGEVIPFTILPITQLQSVTFATSRHSVRPKPRRSAFFAI